VLERMLDIHSALDGATRLSGLAAARVRATVRGRGVHRRSDMSDSPGRPRRRRCPGDEGHRTSHWRRGTVTRWVITVLTGRPRGRGLSRGDGSTWEVFRASSRSTRAFTP